MCVSDWGFTMDIKDAGIIQDLMRKGDPVRRVLAIKLRKEDRLSLKEIQEQTGASKGSLSDWLRPYPLTKAEKKAKMIANHAGGRVRKPQGEASKFWSVLNETLSKERKAQIAESAILFRLALHGFQTAKSMFEGSKTDWLVTVTSGKVVRLQVKWVGTGKHGLPFVSLRRKHGSERYQPHEIDFLVGYDLYTDTAYVFSMKELSHLKATVAVRDDAAERWDKLKG
jgi:hypothetical protein